MSEYSAKSLTARTGKGGKNSKKLIRFLLQMEKKLRRRKRQRGVDYNPGLFQKAVHCLWEEFSRHNPLGLHDWKISRGSREWTAKIFHKQIQGPGKYWKKITTDLATYFMSPGVLDFGSSWNRFLVDSSIKDLVSEQLGYTLFDGMTNEAKRRCIVTTLRLTYQSLMKLLASHISSFQWPVCCQVKTKLNSCCFWIDGDCK